MRSGGKIEPGIYEGLTVDEARAIAQLQNIDLIRIYDLRGYVSVSNTYREDRLNLFHIDGEVCTATVG